MSSSPFGSASASRLPAIARKDAADTVRAVSALVVVVSHAIQIIWLPVVGLGTYTHRINSFLSDTAVIVFFVLSGFLIASSIAANAARNDHFQLGDFALNRAVRIMPPLLFAIGLSVFVFEAMAMLQLPGVVRRLSAPGDVYTARELLSATPEEIWNALTMRNGLLQINGPLWSLYVEVKLYAVAGVFAYGLAGSAPLTLRLVVVAGCLWLGHAAGLGIPAPQWVYCLWWLFGVSFYLVGPRFRSSWVIGTFCACVVGLAVLAVSPVAIEIEALRLAFIAALTIGMFYRWSWSEPFMKSMAAYSYTLYLVHFPILIGAYALLVAAAGTTAPSSMSRFVTSALAVFIAFCSSQIVGRRLEDVRGIQINLQALAARAKRLV